MEENQNIPEEQAAESLEPIVLTPKSNREWTSYFKEFLMLFLAVFAGFLAENYRENLAERAQEKQYMQSLMMDLKEDTAAISKSIIRADFLKKKGDSIILYLPVVRLK